MNGCFRQLRRAIARSQALDLVIAILAGAGPRHSGTRGGVCRGFSLRTYPARGTHHEAANGGADGSQAQVMRGPVPHVLKLTNAASGHILLERVLCGRACGCDGTNSLRPGLDHEAHFRRATNENYGRFRKSHRQAERRVRLADLSRR